MKGKWLKPFSPPSAPAPRDGSSLVPSDDFNKRITAFKRERGLVENFQLTAFCRVQRKHFVTAFERAGPGELFKAVRKEVIGQQGNPTGFHSSDALHVSPSELEGWQCLCGRASYVRCYCRLISCNLTDDGWSCPGCGVAGKLTPLKSVNGSKGSSGASQLFKSANLLMLPRR